MAKLVIAGVADCPYFGRVELLADRLAANLPQFEVRKIIKMQAEWEEFLRDLCERNKWSHHTSPVVWREPVDFGGMKLLIGGSNEFQEYAYGYYGVKSELTSCMMVNVAMENLRFKKEQEAELEADRLSNRPFKIAITRANSAIAYSVLPSFINGQIFGEETEVTIYMHDSVEYSQVLQGVALEVEDTASAMLRGINVCADLREAFVDADFILMLDELRKNPNETRRHWNERKMKHYTNYGHLINQVSKKSVKIALVVRMDDEFHSTYAASTILKAIVDITSSRNIVAICDSTSNNVKSIIGERLEVNPAQVQDTIVWGIRPHPDLLRIDCSQAKVFDSRHSAVWAPTEFSLPVRDLIHDDVWLDRELGRLVVNRLKEKEDQMRHTAALSITGAIVSTLRHWIKGDGGQRIFTLGVASEGWYNVPYGMVFFIPVRLNTPGLWTPVKELELSDKMKNAIQKMIMLSDDEYYHLAQSDDSLTLAGEEAAKADQSISSVRSKEPDAPDSTTAAPEKDYNLDNITELPPKTSSGEIVISPDSFQRLHVYQLETEAEPMVEVERLEHESVTSVNGDQVSQKEDSLGSLSDENELHEVISEVIDLTDENKQQGEQG